MCGIFGIVFKDKNRSVREIWLRDVISSMTHRGPDDEGIFTYRNIGLGHRRLSIIDLSTGHQPLFNESGDICVVFNGEIYNFVELRHELEAAGHIFKTKSDTEVIVHSYEEWKRDCVNRLRGMFAFGIYDKRQKSLFIARDRLGIKPLYFYYDEKVFIFASEIKAILKTGFVLPEVNYAAIDFYMSLGYVPAPETAYKNIYKLEPGNCIMADESSMSKYSYWTLTPNIHASPSYDEACREFEKIFSECVDSHLMSDVPLGVFLSGGLDSSAVVGFMSRKLNIPVKTFSVGYENAGGISELAFARKIADEFKTEHHELILEPEDFFESINKFLYYAEEPVVESAAIALYQLSKLAKSYVTVLLSGEGADELFGGYPLYWKMKKIERYYNLFRFVPGNKAGSFFRLLPEKYQKYLYWVSVPFETRYGTVSCDIIPSIKKSMYTTEFRKIIDTGVETFFADIYKKLLGMSHLQKMLFVDTKYWLPDDLLLKADKMTMATSVELRVPFLDHKLVEFAFSLPDNYKVDKVQGKLLFKKAVEGLLPKEIIYRQKRGFPVPISKWFAGDLYNGASEILLDKESLERKYFNRYYIEEVLLKHKNGQDMSRRIFSLLALELWHRMYIDGGNRWIGKVSI